VEIFLNEIMLERYTYWNFLVVEQQPSASAGLEKFAD